jgi:F-type H+-transporting ATPase subunit a
MESGMEEHGAEAAGHGAEAAGHGAEAAGHGAETGLPNPMHQFEIKRLIPLELFGFDASFTNSALFMVIAAVVITLFALYAMRGGRLIPTRLQSVAELSYEFVANMVRDNVGTSGMKYFPFIFTLFMFVLTLNMLGMLPYSFTVTSHIIVTFALAAFVFIGVTLIGFWKHGVGFLKFFVPAGVPAVMLPLLVVIEVISYLTRPLSLSVRLFANMMAGHTMLKVFGAFVVALGLLGGWAPLAFMVGFTGLEILVAFLQAYVFAILTCIYLNDALHMHH